MKFYPALAGLCGLSVTESIDGQSLVEALEDPRAEGQGEAFGYSHPRACEDNPHSPGPWAKTIRTDRYRFTRWTTEIEHGEVVQLELYDHSVDPHEVRNLANERPDIVSSLTRRREVYAGVAETPAIVDLKAGRVVVKRDGGMPVVDSEDLADALDD